MSFGEDVQKTEYNQRKQAHVEIERQVFSSKRKDVINLPTPQQSNPYKNT